jgi:nitroreductase
MENNFDVIQNIIKNRRTLGPAIMNGKAIPNDQVKQILALADWAPTHGYTEPWKYFIYTGEALKEFSKAHADMYWNTTEESHRDENRYKKLLTNTEKVSHLIVAAMKRGSNAKIPIIEEIAAASASIQNILLGATALGIASMWNTSGMTFHPALKDYLKLADEDQVLGMIFLGYADIEMEGKRKIPMEEKFVWM